MIPCRWEYKQTGRWRVAADVAWRMPARRPSGGPAAHGGTVLRSRIASGRIRTLSRKPSEHGCTKQPWHTVRARAIRTHAYSSPDRCRRNDTAGARSGFWKTSSVPRAGPPQAVRPCLTGPQDDAVFVPEEVRSALGPRAGGGGAWRKALRVRRHPGAITIGS